jgi:hypothetical protein
MKTYKTTDLGAASYVLTKLKDDFIRVSSNGKQSFFEFKDTEEVKRTFEEFFLDKDGFLTYRNNLNSLKTLAKHALNKTY